MKRHALRLLALLVLVVTAVIAIAQAHRGGDDPSLAAQPAVESSPTVLTAAEDDSGPPRSHMRNI